MTHPLIAFVRDPEKTIEMDRGDVLDLARDLADALEAALRNVSDLTKRLEKANEFFRDLADNWDCDTRANGIHLHNCRECRAEEWRRSQEGGT